MAKQCEVCGKKAQVGNLVSHSNIKTKRRVRTIVCCTRCIRSGAVRKPSPRNVNA